MKIGVTVSPATGHLNAMTALARRIESRGHEVICLGTPDAARGVAAANLRFEELCGDPFPSGSFALRLAELSKLSGPDALAYTMDWIHEACRAELQELPGLLKLHQVDGLVVDRISPGAGAVAMAMNIPFVHVSCTPLADLSGVTPLFFFPWPHQDSEPARERNRKGVTDYLQLAGGIRASTLEYLHANGVSVDTSDIHWAESKLAYLTQVPAAFDFPGDHLPAHFHRTGPFHDGAGREPVQFPWEKLTGAPLIYASLGTVQNGLEHVFRTILSAVERPGYQLVLSVGMNIGPESLETSRPDTIVVQRAPQIELLKLATLCVTHAGLNTTLEALAQGVPLVAIPIANDQPGVAARILASGTGLFLPLAQLTPEGLSALVDEVLRNPSYRKRAREMKTAIANVDGLEMATDIIEKALKAASG